MIFHLVHSKPEIISLAWKRDDENIVKNILYVCTCLMIKKKKRNCYIDTTNL